jgi:AraC family transcriptional regulator
MLARRDLPLAEIAYRAGFASQAHFSTAFRRATGTTPARYRAETES